MLSLPFFWTAYNVFQLKFSFREVYNWATNSWIFCCYLAESRASDHAHYFHHAGTSLPWALISTWWLLLLCSIMTVLLIRAGSSAGTNLQMGKFRTACIHTCCIVVPSLWNALPEGIRKTSILPAFQTLNYLSVFSKQAMESHCTKWFTKLEKLLGTVFTTTVHGLLKLGSYCVISASFNTFTLCFSSVFRFLVGLQP